MALRALNLDRGGVSSRSLRDGAVIPSKLSRYITAGQYALEPCVVAPRGAAVADNYGAPTGATGDTNLLTMQALQMSYFILGAGQTLLAPTGDSVTGGIRMGLDAAASEGVEYVPGARVTAFNPFAVTIGAEGSKNPFIRVTSRLATVANVDHLAVGFRKAEVSQALIADYDELAAISAIAGEIHRYTILNTAAAVDVDTGLTVADAEDFTLEVRLIGRRAHFYFNDVEAPTGAPYDFDDGEVVIPFIHFIQGAGGGSLWRMFDLEVGPLDAIGLDPARR